MDVIKEEFLTEMRDFMDERCRKVSSELEHGLDIHLPELIEALQKCINPLLTEFFNAEKKGAHGALTWVYFSYLRSGVLTHTECIQVDCYDEKNRISDIETAKKWNFFYVWDPFYAICREMKKEFEYQTRIKEYELDLLIFDLAESFYNLTKSFFGVILEKWLEEYGAALLAGKCVNFMMGEYMDRAEFVLRWNNTHIEWTLENDSEDARDEMD